MGYHFVQTVKNKHTDQMSQIFFETECAASMTENIGSVDNSCIIDSCYQISRYMQTCTTFKDHGTQYKDRKSPSQLSTCSVLTSSDSGSIALNACKNRHDSDDEHHSAEAHVTSKLSPRSASPDTSSHGAHGINPDIYEQILQINRILDKFGNSNCNNT